MRFKSIYLFAFFVISVIIFAWLDSSTVLSDELQFLLFGQFLVHGIAIVISLLQLNKFKFPFILFISSMNLVTFFIAPAIIDSTDFQLGTLNYEILTDLLLGFCIFYSTYFYIIWVNSKNRKITIQSNHSSSLKIKTFVKLKRFFIFLYIFQLFVSFPVSGLNEFIEFFTIGLFAIGFLLKVNSKFEDLLFISLLSIQSIKVITSSLIYAIIYFAIFLAVIFKNYSFKSKRGYFVFLSLMSLFLIFTILFSPVKNQYRAYEFSTGSVVERLVVISNLIISSDLTNYENTIEKKTKDGPVWRLSYPLSAISLVKEKTPSTIPYWKGESYLPILTKLIPRFLWSNKPSENMGQEFGHRYGILAWDNLTTSMNTPIIAEAYMNFGETGFYLIFFIMALVMTKVYGNQNTISKDLFSVDTIIETITIAIATVYFTQWESNLTMMIGKFIILYVTTKLIRRFIIQA